MKKHRGKLILACFMALALIDIWSTHGLIIRWGTTAVEKNMVMKWVMDTYGMAAAYVFRLIIPAIGVPFLLKIEKDREHGLLATHMIYVMWLLHIAVVGWHIYLWST